MPMWMLFVLIYAIIKGIREIFKKKALEENSVIEVLFVYSLLSLLMAIPQFPKAGGITGPQYAGTAFKAFAMFVAWLAGFSSIKKLPLSLIGVLDLSRVLFATLLGVVILGEQMTVYKSVGLVFVAAGLLFLKFIYFSLLINSSPFFFFFFFFFFFKGQTHSIWKLPG